MIAKGGDIVRTQAAILALAAAASLAAVNANAQMSADNDQHHFIVLDSSTMDDVRAIGGQSIGNLGDYQGYGGLLDITDPANWGIADADMSTLPSVTVDPNSTNIDGTLEINDGSVSAATLNLLGELSFGLFQSTPGWDGATTERLANMVTTGMVWQYDAASSTLIHDAGATTTCVTVGAQGGTGSCNLYAGSTRQGAPGNGNSIWNWDGLVDGWTASNTRGVLAFPWGADTCDPGPCPAGHIVVAQDGGTPGVNWDLSGLSDCETQDTCSITARVVASGMGAAANGGNNTGVSALYTLNLQVDKSPRAVDDATVVQAGTPEALDVLANDYIYDRDDFDLSLDTDGTRGTAVVLGGNMVHYAPPEDASGTDSFSYTIDSEGAQSTATVTITLNKQPVGQNASITTISTLGIAPDSTSGSFTIPAANLGDLPATVTFAGATKGTVTVDGATLAYTPHADFYSGADTFTYTITDNDGETAGGTITVTIEDVAPAVTIEAATTRVGVNVSRPLAITAGNGPLASHTRAVTTEEHGSCSLNEAGTEVSFSPEAGFRGEGSCTVTVTDLDGSTASARFAVTVRAAPAESSGGSSSLDLWLLSMLAAGIWLRRRRPA